MFPLHPALSEAHARARVDELQRQARHTTVHRRARRTHPRRHAMRTTTGWFLVNLGLRLAISPRPRVTPVAQ